MENPETLAEAPADVAPELAPPVVADVPDLVPDIAPAEPAPADDIDAPARSESDILDALAVGSVIEKHAYGYRIQSVVGSGIVHYGTGRTLFDAFDAIGT